MFALLTLGLFVVELGVYALAGWWMLSVTHWSLPGVVALMVVVAAVLRVIATLQSVLLSRVRGSPYPPDMHPTIGMRLRLLALETGAMCALFPALAMSERWLGLRTPPADAAAGDERLAVLMVHGYICNGSYWWSMVHYFRRHGVHSTYTVNLEPVFGSIDVYAGQIADTVDRILTRQGIERVVILAHSMGGLAARRYLASDRVHAQIIGLVTLGSPHQGTFCAYFSPTTNSRQMRPGSAFLESLEAGGATRMRVPVTSVYSYDDNIVLPQLSSKIAGGRNVATYGVAHVSLSFHAGIQRIALDEVRRMDDGQWSPGTVVMRA